MSGSCRLKMKKIILVTVLFIVLMSPLSRASAGAISRIGGHAAGDLKTTTFGLPFLLLAGGGVASMGLSQWDDRISSHFKDNRALGKADTVGDWIGKPYIWDTSAAAVWGVGLISKNETLNLTGESMVEALAITEATVGIFKVSARRERPNGGNYSFPSGHVARTFAVASVLETLHGPAIGVPAFLLASFVSYTRIDSDAHYLSDAAFGAALGSAIGWGVAKFHKPGDRLLFVTPTFGEINGLSVACRF